MGTMSHSRYWLDRDIFEVPDKDEAEEKDLDRILRLSAARRAVANFVNILTGRNDIVVKFSGGKTSVTNGQEIIIAADDNPEHFDSMVGLALHEASHVLLTDFRFLGYIHGVRQSVSGMWHKVGGGAVISNSKEMAPYYSKLNTDTSTPENTNHVMMGDTITCAERVFHPALTAILTLKRNGDARLVTPGGVWQDVQYMEGINVEWATLAHTMFTDLHTLMNILEDRRIDKYVYQNASGYRPYYKALYNRYFFTKETGKNLKYNPEWRELTIENYINRLLLMFHPDADVNAMPGLQQLYDLIDLQHIDRLGGKWTPPAGVNVDNPLTYAQTPLMWQVANEIYVQIVKFAGFGQLKRELITEGLINIPGWGELTREELEALLQEVEDLEGEPEQEDFTATPVQLSPRGKTGKYNPSKGNKDIEKAKDAMQGDIRKKKASKVEIEQASALEAADAKMVDVKGEGIPYGRVMVTRKLTESVFQQEWFIFKNWNWYDKEASTLYTKAISAGKRMGQILVHRLQVRNDPMMTKQTRLPTGGLDRRLLAQLGMNITSVFQKSRTDIHRPVMLHLTLDASGSMHGNKWAKAMTVASAIAYLGSKMRNVDVVITIRGGGDKVPMVCVIHDSRKDSYPHFVANANRLCPNGGTPEGLCYKATMDLILECTSTHDVYFINFSDGEPSWTVFNPASKAKRQSCWEPSNCFNYAGDVAFKHTRQMVKLMQENGVKVLSYFITDNTYGNWGLSSGNAASFRRMYGETAEFVNVENATEVLRTLNKLLLVRG